MRVRSGLCMIMIVILLPNFINASFAMVELTSDLNPDTVKPNERVEIIVMIKNTDLNSTKINTIKIISPNWIDNSIELNEVLLKGEILHHSFEILIPNEIEEGNYDVITLVSTMDGDYLTKTNFNVQKLTKISLSGDIPIAIIIILLTGIGTYALISYMITGKLENPLSQIILIGFGFGFIDWFLIGKTIENVAKSSIQDYIFVTIISVVIAFTFLGIVASYKYLNKKYKISKKFNEFQTSIIKHGLAHSIKPAWHSFVFDQTIDLKNTLGKGYGLIVKVHVNDENKDSFEGYLWYAEPESPRDVVLHSQYIISSNKKDFVESLIQNKDLRMDIKKNKELREKLEKYVGVSLIEEGQLKIENNLKKPEEDWLHELKTKLLAEKEECFLTIFKINGIDISNYAFKIAVQLRDKPNTSVERKYDNVNFIPVEHIRNIEVIGAGTKYRIKLNDKITIPESYSSYDNILHTNHNP